MLKQPKILVAIRKRPLSKKQASHGETDILQIKGTDTVILSQEKKKVDLTKYLQETVFNFDFAFNQLTNNSEVAVRPLVDSAFQGAKVTCFAYGQTGSGKTFTMNGQLSQGIKGLYTYGAEDIFRNLNEVQYQNWRAQVSFFQIYCGKLYDLLNKRKELKILQDKKNNINIIGLEGIKIHTTQEFIELLNYGSTQRITSQNSANVDSSRSHAILQISLKEGKKLTGKISFIDLAGNQRGADHMDMGKQTRIDGAEINKSLLSLKECIRALDLGKGHTPFRGSKLTMVLKDSFVGFCRTVMIGNVSPSSASSQNTLNTLRYADRVKQLRKPAGEQLSPEDHNAREMMLPRQNHNAIKIMIDKDDDAEDIAKKRSQAQKEFGLKFQDSRKQVSNTPKKLSIKNQLQNQNKGQNSVKINAQNNVKKGNIQESYTDRSQTNRHHNQSSGHNNIVRRSEQPMDLQQPLKVKRVDSTKDNYISKNNSNIALNNLRNRSSTKNELSQGQNQGSFTGLQGFQNNLKIGNPNLMQNNSTIGNYNQPTNTHNNTSINKHPIYSNNPPINNYHNNYNHNYNPNAAQMGYNPNSPNREDMKQIGHSQSTQQINHNSIQNKNIKSNQVNKSINQVVDIPMTNKSLQGLSWSQTVNYVLQNPGQSTMEYKQRLHERLFAQQNKLLDLHSNTLRKQINIIKSQMSLLSQLQINRNKITSREYAQYLSNNIEQKVSALLELRQSLIQFQYKLDDVQQIQRLDNADDQLLLDDLN